MLSARAAAPDFLRRSAPLHTAFVFCCARARASAAGAGTDLSQDSQVTVAADSQATAGKEPQATVADITAWLRAREP